MKLYQIALLSASTVAAAHVHRHHARHGSPLKVRDAAVTETVPGPIVTVYELGGKDISYEDVEKGLKNGKYVLVGETISTVIPATTPSTSSTPTPTPSSSSEAAEFFQKKVSSTTSEEPTPTPTTSATPAPATTSTSSSSSSSSSSGNIGAEFPSGTIDCSTFPSEYGAVYLDWLGLEGWSGVQNVPDFDGDLTLNASIANIATAISGSGCTANSFCSYACPPGYQKSQWPLSQGSTGESIGGLYCNSNGKLELSRSSVPQICIEGAGGVQVKNTLSENVAICRTDYPGTEGETIPLDATPGGTFPLTNVNSADYYTWKGSSTSAQYYINPSGVSVGDACCWGSAGTNIGNWAPVNAGVGKGADGVTFISLFPNSPTNPDGTLDFNIKIVGDVSVDCEYKNGAYYQNSVKSATGCSVSFNPYFFFSSKR